MGIKINLSELESKIDGMIKIIDNLKEVNSSLNDYGYNIVVEKLQK